MAHRDSRPLSPHIGIYKPQISSVLSILHRITGIALAVGTVPLVGWLWSAAYSAGCFAAISAFFSTAIGIALLIGWSFALYFHLANGIRHLFWDAGLGYSIPAMTRSGILVILAAFGLTGGTWWCIATRIVS